jgi:DNA helicase HerA-like ATPase
MSGGQTLFLTILGMTGSGKSTLTREIIREYDRVLILDSMGEYDDIPNAIVREGANDCVNALLSLKDKPRWILDCLTLHDQEAFDILAVAFEIPNILIVIEEASLYCDPHTLPDEIARLIRYGRKRGIHIIFIARRPSEINRELTAQSKLIVTFRQTEPIDIQYLKARMGAEAESVPHLKDWKVAVAGDRSLAPLAVLARIERKPLTMEEPEEDTAE